MFRQRQKAVAAGALTKPAEIKKGRNTFSWLRCGKWRRSEGALECHHHLLHRIKASRCGRDDVRLWRYPG